ncbi:MAG: hypothetical protein J6H18_00065, partial [Lachnospiraceae bacterium]|nr:hypothetical protein [Lachnospiraceae bacterium]
LMDGQEPLIRVTVYVDELVVRSFMVGKVVLIGEEAGFRYDYNPAISVSIRALEEDFAAFNPSSIQATVDVTEYANNPGTYNLQVVVHCEDQEIFMPLEGPRIEVIIKAEAPPTRERTTTAPTTTVPPTTEAPSSEMDPTETLPANP